MANEDLEQNEPIQSAPVEANDVVESPAPEVREYSDTEKRAMEQGWVPEDQWNGTGRWRSAEDFLDRGELFSKIDEVKRRAERAERTLEDLKKHHSKVKEVEFRNAMAYLKQQKAEAVAEGDGAKVVELDDRIDQAKQEHARNQAQQNQPQEEFVPHPAFVTWLNQNEWYNTDRAMKAYADAVAVEAAQRGENNPVKVLEEVSRQVRKHFVEKFENPNRNKPSAVDGGGRNASASKKDDFQLTPEETQVMNRFVKAGVMTKEEYKAEIKAARGA